MSTKISLKKKREPESQDLSGASKKKKLFSTHVEMAYKSINNGKLVFDTEEVSFDRRFINFQKLHFI